MDRMFTIIVLAFVVIFICSLLWYSANKKCPPIVEKGDDKSKPDFYIVKAIALYRSGGYSYCTYTFVKKKDGKYKLKLSLLDILSIMISVFMLEGLFFWLFIGYLVNSVEPIDIKIVITSFFLFIFISWFLVLLHVSEIVAVIYFRKYIKRERKAKSYVK